MKKVCIVENNVVTNTLVIADDADPSDFGAVDLGIYADIGAPVVDGALDETEYLKMDMISLRNGLLSDTDWWAVSDRTMTQAQIDYRQALRDLPAQEGFPNVDMPEFPEE